MTLAVMMIAGKDEWRCDLAETYHIYDYKALPAETLAVLSSGLRENSRIQMKISGRKEVPHDLLIADIADTLRAIVYSLSGSKTEPEWWRNLILCENKPNDHIKENRAIRTYDTVDDFHRAWSEITGR